MDVGCDSDESSMFACLNFLNRLKRENQEAFENVNNQRIAVDESKQHLAEITNLTMQKRKENDALEKRLIELNVALGKQIDHLDAERTDVESVVGSYIRLIAERDALKSEVERARARLYDTLKKGGRRRDDDRGSEVKGWASLACIERSCEELRKKTSAIARAIESIADEMDAIKRAIREKNYELAASETSLRLSERRVERATSLVAILKYEASQQQQKRLGE